MPPMSANAPPEISSALLAFLRSTLRDTSLSYASPPEPVSGGFDTAIYGFSLGGAVGEMAGPLILRVFRDGGAVQAQFETAVQNTVSSQGYPTPRVLLLCDDATVLGGAFTIMPRIDGVPMLDRVLSPRRCGSRCSWRRCRRACMR
jgi:aminoglycoside phosphotransferase (APT) family kinase protein